MHLIRFSIDNPLVTNLMLAVIVIAGVLSWYAMPQEMFPVVELDKVRITTLFEGASPEEVERQVTAPIEEELEGMADIDEILSTSAEGLSTININLKSGADVDDFLRDARNAVNRILTLPDEAEEPELTRLKTRFPVISMALYGEVGRGYLLETADRVKSRIQELPGVASVGVAGDREWELWVVVDPERLAARGVTLAEVTAALRANLRDLPGGSLQSGEGDILLRGMGAAPDARAVEAVVVRANAAGGRLTLGEVARVELRLEEAKTLGRFAGRPSVNLTVNKTVEASAIVVAREMRELTAKLRQELPAGVGVGLFSDLSVYIENRLNTVKSSAVVGLVLVLASLYLFLNLRVALITAMGIPVSFLVAVIALNYLGYSVNMVSLFAFLIALGLVVDDAIIVTENVYRHVEQGMEPHVAADVGAREVFWPVVASTATTVAAFLPMFAIGGTMGTFIAVIPVVVTAALLGSLWEGFTVLPSHAAEMLRVKPVVTREDGGRERRVDWGAMLSRYAALIRWSACHRYLVAALVVGGLILSLTYAATRVPFYLFGKVDVGQFFVNVEAPNTYRLEDSTRLAARMEGAIRDALREGELKSLLANVGVTFIDFNRIEMVSNRVQLMVDLEKRRPEGFIENWVTPLVSLNFSREGSRGRDTRTIINAIRERLQAIPGIERLSILRPQGGPAGADIEVGVQGPELDVLSGEADAVRDYLARLPGVYDVRLDLEPGKLEYRYALNERGRNLGLTQQQLSEAVRTGFLGLKALYVTHHGKRIPVRVIYPDRLRHDGGALERLRITLPGGGAVFLGEVADIEVGRALSTVHRRDGRRLATVTAEVDNAVITAREVTELVQQQFADIGERHAGYRLLFLGEKKKTAESVADMQRAMVLALAVIFFILAALFKSLLDPLVVMFAIPFGAIGVIAGHALFGESLQFLSLIGFLALAGIVVNDSLILVDFAKRLRGEGWGRIDAIAEAGRVRVRPILLTTVTTFLGVSPLIFFATGQTAFLAPMAISLGVGLLFATVLILVALPCFYLIADDLRHWLCPRARRLFGIGDGAHDADAPLCRLGD
ncbi:efflux RND transporter permease subunit [Endothiovibrio diazotrophicus]